MPGGACRVVGGAGWEAGGVLGFPAEESPPAWLESLAWEVPPPHAQAGIAIADCAAPAVARTPPNRTIRERVGARASSDSALGSYSTAEREPTPSVSPLECIPALAVSPDGRET
jgi:hypothetical protein